MADLLTVGDEMVGWMYSHGDVGHPAAGGDAACWGDRGKPLRLTNTDLRVAGGEPLGEVTQPPPDEGRTVTLIGADGDTVWRGSIATSLAAAPPLSLPSQVLRRTGVATTAGSNDEAARRGPLPSPLVIKAPLSLWSRAL